MTFYLLYKGSAIDVIKLGRLKSKHHESGGEASSRLNISYSLMKFAFILGCIIQ